MLVEQNAKMALSVADRAYVLENGKISMTGNAHVLLDDEKVRQGVFGGLVPIYSISSAASFAAFIAVGKRAALLIAAN